MTSVGVPAGTVPGMAHRPYAYAVAVALTAGLLAAIGALWLGLPLRDPDGVAGPSYIRLPGLVIVALVADIAPRAWYRTPRMLDFFTTSRRIASERWSWDRLRLVVIGLGCFYLSYVAYRNIKSFLPFVNDALFDDVLGRLDRALLFGHRPAVVLHELLGTGIAAHALSTVYVFYLFFVPLSLAAALVWSDHVRKGFWYVTALCLNWLLGAASYYVLPSLGPFYLQSGDFADLPETGASTLQVSLLWGRWTVLTDPHATEAVHGIGAFASLHVSVVFTAALIVHRLGMNRWLQLAMWLYTLLTTLATVYFGWHYLADDIGGVAIGYLSVAFGAKATGYEPWSLRRVRDAEVPHGTARGAGVDGPGEGAESVGAPQESRRAES